MFLRWIADQIRTNGGIVPLNTAAQVSDVLDLIGDDQGDILYRGTGEWETLPAGTIDYVLTSGGPGADPAWGPAVHDFLDLSDTPSSYVGEMGRAVRVNAGETGLEFYTPVFSFLGLTDTPGSYAGSALYGVRVNAGATALEFHLETFLDLADTPSVFGAAGSLVQVNTGANALEFTRDPGVDTIRVGIGTTTVKAHISGDAATVSTDLISADVVLVSSESTAVGMSGVVASSVAARRPTFKGTRAGGTLASPSAPNLDDLVVSFLGTVWDGAALRATASVDAVVDGTVSSANAPQRLIFQTGATTTRTERMRIGSDGRVSIGSSTLSAQLFVNGAIRPASYATGSLPSASTNGAGALVRDSTTGELKMSDGVTWNAVGGGGTAPLGFAKFTKPGNTFSVINSGSPTTNAYDSTNNTWKIVMTGAQGNSWAYRSVTAGAAFDVIMRLHFFLWNDSFLNLGVWFGQASTAQKTAWALTYNGGFNKAYWNGTTFESETSVRLPAITFQSVLYFRLTRVSTTVSIYMSVDGLTWVLVGSDPTNASGLTDVDQVGFFLDSNGLTGGIVASIECFGWDTTQQTEAKGS